MRRFLIPTNLLFILIASQATQVAGSADFSPPDSRHKISSNRSFPSLPLTFIENRGQWDEAVMFRAEAGGATVWLTAGGAHYQFTRAIEGGARSQADDPIQYETLIIKAAFAGASSNPRIFGDKILGTKYNYFLGDDPARWATDVPGYEAVILEDIYPGIDLKYYGNGSRMEYDFIVAAGADPSEIKIRYEGARSILVDDDGRLLVRTEWGDVFEEKPVIYQVVSDQRQPVDGEYALYGDRTFGFSLSGAYDPALPVVIDPVLGFSTYVGGTDDEIVFDAAVDAGGSVYVAGYTSSTDFPTQSPYQGTLDAGTDVFVTKLNSMGDGLVYSTYIGGSSNDNGFGIAVDNSGNAYVTGKTASTDFPTQTAYQAAYGGGTSDVFVTKLNDLGNALVYSTYLGGTLDEDGNAIEVDVSGNAYVAGRVKSTDFPTQNPYQAAHGGGTYDGFALKLGATGSTLTYSSYLGGPGWDWNADIAIDNAGQAYVVGTSASVTDFPIKNAYQASFAGGPYDVTISKFGSDGDTLVFSTFLGGTDYDAGYAIAVDDAAYVYVSGNTASSNFPTQNPYQAAYGGGVYDAFVTKLNSSGGALEYSTYLGGGGSTHWDVCYGLAVDGNSRVYAAGYTNSLNFPTANPYQQFKAGDVDTYLANLDSLGNTLIFSTYFGGTGEDICNAVVLDNGGSAYLAGYTASVDLPTQTPYQAANAGGAHDAFVARFDGVFVSVDETSPSLLPSGFTLEQNYPNPFNPTTTIEFNLTRRDHVKIEIVNVLGKNVCTLLDREMPSGPHAVNWNGRDGSGKTVATGVYFYRLGVGDRVEVKKMLLLK